MGTYLPLEDVNYRKLLNFAMRALTARAYTEAEMRTKLQKKEFITKELEDAVIERLKDLKFLDDISLVSTSLLTASRIKLEGHIKVASKLSKKGIPFKKTEEIWRDLEINEREVAINALKKAEKRFIGLDKEKTFQKKVRFLASKGFSPELIFELASK